MWAGAKAYSAKVAAAVARLEARGYAGWFVVEQDRLLFDGDTLESVLADQRHNCEFLRGPLSADG